MKGIENLKFRSNYWDDPRARDEFKSFLDSVHGLDLTLWEQKGFWDDLYTPFSLFDGERVVSSMCLYSMDMIIGGEKLRIGQFSSVGTLPTFRRRGLNRWLSEKAIKWASPTHDGFFLLSTDEAVPFYGKRGFALVQERAATLTVRDQQSRPGLRRLDMQNDSDLEQVYRLACDRTPVSDVMGVWNPKLLMYHCLYGLRDHVYHIPDLDVIVLCKTDHERLTLFDVVGRRIPPFSKLHPYLATQPHREVLFYFMTDKMEIRAGGWEIMKENNTHLHRAFRLPEPNYLFPYTAHA